MRSVKVTYTTKAEYAAQNKANIREVMNDLQKLNSPAINYNCCVCADDKTFIHSAFFKSEEDQKTLFDLPSFQRFQEQLKASGPEVPPKTEQLSLVGTSKDIFG
jgi:hypothetical protein